MCVFILISLLNSEPFAHINSPIPFPSYTHRSMDTKTVIPLTVSESLRTALAKVQEDTRKEEGELAHSVFQTPCFKLYVQFFLMQRFWSLGGDVQRRCLFFFCVLWFISLCYSSVVVLNSELLDVDTLCNSNTASKGNIHSKHSQYSQLQQRYS